MGKKEHRLYFILVLVFLTLLSSCERNNDTIIPLDTKWSYSINGIHGNYIPFDLADFAKIKKSLPDRKGSIYLKTSFSIPLDLKNKTLKCFLGNIKIASEFYLNGNYIGSTGFFPPYIFSTGGRSTSYIIPYVLCNEYQNEIILHIYVESEGKFDIKPFISTTSRVLTFEKTFDFFNSKLHLICSWVMMIIGVMYIGVFNLRKQDKQYLSFALMNVFSSLFMVSLCIGEYPVIYQAGFSYLLYEKLFRGIASILSSYFAVSFMKNYLKAKESLSWKIFRSAITIGPCFFIMFSNTMRDFFVYLGIAYFAVAIQMIYACIMIFANLRKNKRKVLELLAGFSPVILSVLVTAIIYLASSKIYSLIIVLGWQVTVFVFLGMLIGFFVSQCNRVDFLNSNLEKLVQNRTEELTRANTSLEEMNSHLKYEVERADKEIELASFVQKSFYSLRLPEFKNFEVAYYNKPMAGVSGDLYDFYFTKDTLDGFGLFDVSGHGISSGLVTMLVKNIINDEFNKGKKLALHDVLYTINDRIILQKGNVENYLTGILARVKGNEIDFVNAGHPNAILLRAKDNKLITIPRGKADETGVVGIADFPVHFETVTQTIEKNDILLLYTDGLAETMNRNREEFGLDRMCRTFLKFSDLPLEQQIENIVEEARIFANRAKATDDITLLLLKKK
ncbi:MAG: SpoIIE family protein phosphatase [Treponema sp.]|nr:SpoIIE family protein phosphatase [Treponema sp.]